jgi:hypothetical protein
MAVSSVTETIEKMNVVRKALQNSLDFSASA